MERLTGLLDSPSGSITLFEKGELKEIPRHPDFRLFACMNPPSDIGKKELPNAIRSKFSEFFVEEPTIVVRVMLCVGLSLLLVTGVCAAVSFLLTVLFFF